MKNLQYSVESRLERVNNQYDANYDVPPYGTPQVTWVDMRLVECIEDMAKEIENLKSEISNLRSNMMSRTDPRLYER
jgi:hypothetical protein